MNRSLTLVLPVRNLESQLASRLHAMVDAVDELTDDLEIVIVNDASTDSTEEVAAELATTYPQVTTINHAVPLGATEAIRVGVQQSRNDVVLIHNLEVPFSDSALRRLWSMRDDEELVMASSEMKGPARMAQASWMGVETKLLRRRAMNELEPPCDAGVLINRVTRTDMKESLPTPTALPTREESVGAEPTP